MQVKSYDELINKAANYIHTQWIYDDLAEKGVEGAKELAQVFNQEWHEILDAIGRVFILDEEQSPFCEALDLAGEIWDRTHGITN